MKRKGPMRMRNAAGSLPGKGEAAREDGLGHHAPHEA